MIRKLLLGVFFLASIGWVHGQNKAQQLKMEKRALFYAEEAAKEFDLNKKKKSKVFENKLAQMKANQALMKRKKNEEFADEEAFKAERREIMKPYMDTMLGLTGVKRKELAAFNKKTNPKLKDVK